LALAHLHRLVAFPKSETSVVRLTTSQQKGDAIMLKKLMLILFLAMILGGPATPIFKSFFGIGSTTAYAQNDDDQGEDDDDQGEDEQ
jgi:hypothetical protein